MNQKVIDDMEKAMLINWERDGCLVRRILGFKGMVISFQAIVEDTEQARVAANVAAYEGCDTVMQISEGWKAFFPKGQDLKQPSTMPSDDRDECAMIAAADVEGGYIMIEYTVNRVTRKLERRYESRAMPEVDRLFRGLFSNPPAGSRDLDTL